MNKLEELEYKLKRRFATERLKFVRYVDPMEIKPYISLHVNDEHVKSIKIDAEEITDKGNIMEIGVVEIWFEELYKELVKKIDDFLNQW